jgi:SH3 domain protein
MRSLAAIHCLVIATVLSATVPLVGSAQEQPPESAAPDEQQPVSAPVPQRRFVSDKLVLNVHAEPQQGSGRVATIQTGDAVDELERSGNMVRVRLDDGREGWVGASYLVNDPPAAVQLRELQRQQPNAAANATAKADKLAQEVAQLKKENLSLRTQVDELQARVKAQAEQISQQAAVANADASRQADMPDAMTEAGTLGGTSSVGSVLGWLVAMMFVGALSFAGGYQALARRLRKKFGGLKIY